MKITERYFTKNKNIKVVSILVAIALLIFLITFILWNILFSKYYIFDKQENLFQETVEKYYYYKQNLLPKKGEIREIKLEKLFLEERIEALYEPKTKVLCDTDSWVRVYQNEKGEYIYYTYLKCGKYESKIDHNGPVITLNGEKEIIINHNEEYKELGVKTVIDDIDGKIDISKVEIDSSKVDTTKTGSYKVTYKVRDNLNNETKVTRTVIVARNLTETVKKATDESNYYKGKVENNYVQFSGMLWRIINVNSDGSVKLITDNPIANLRSEEDKYKGSNVEKWLNDYFYPNINENSKKFMADTAYCVSNLTQTTDLSNICSETVNAKVGLLNLQELLNSRANNESHIIDSTHYMLGNKLGDKLIVASNYMGTGYDLFDKTKLPAVKPVITLKKDLYIQSGNGTKEKPFKLADYQYAKEHDKIKTRIVGEYINYSGMIARIIDVEKENVKVILAQPLMNNTTITPLTISFMDGTNHKFELSDDKSYGYILNNDYIDYINENDIIAKKYKIPTNTPGKKYSEYKGKEVKAKLVLPATYELFSSVDDNELSRTYRFIYSDNSEIENSIFMLSTSNGIAYELLKNDFNYYAIKPLFTLNGNLEIKSGNGTINSPYYLK